MLILIPVFFYKVIPINNDTASCNTIPINATDLSGLANYTFRPTLTDCSHDIMAGLLGSNETQWHWAKLCMLMGGEWNRFSIHFDHLGAAYLALYQTATFEGWMEVMEYGVDHNPVVSMVIVPSCSEYGSCHLLQDVSDKHTMGGKTFQT